MNDLFEVMYSSYERRAEVLMRGRVFGDITSKILFNRAIRLQVLSRSLGVFAELFKPFPPYQADRRFRIPTCLDRRRAPIEAA